MRKNITVLLCMICMLYPFVQGQTVLNFTINQPAPLSVDAGINISVCEGDTITLNGTVSNGMPGFLYSWTPISTIVNPYVEDPDVFPSATGYYNFAVQDTNNCTSTDSVFVSIIAAPSASFSSTVTNLLVNFAGSSPNTITSWDWDYGDGNIGTGQSPSHTYAAAGSYTVCLTVSYAIGCTFDTCSTVIATPVGIVDRLAENMLEVFPNPYSGSTKIVYQLTHAAEVRLEVLDLTGRKVTSLAEETQAAGDHEYGFSAVQKGLSAGVYIVRLQVDGKEISRKIVEHK